MRSPLRAADAILRHGCVGFWRLRIASALSDGSAPVAPKNSPAVPLVKSVLPSSDCTVRPTGNSSTMVTRRLSARRASCSRCCASSSRCCRSGVLLRVLCRTVRPTSAASLRIPAGTPRNPNRLLRCRSQHYAPCTVLEEIRNDVVMSAVRCVRESVRNGAESSRTLRARQEERLKGGNLDARDASPPRLRER